MTMTLKDADTLKAQILATYAENAADKEAIEALCFARNVAEIVADYFYSTHNKVEFYRGLMNDPRLTCTFGVKTLEKYYGYLK